LYRAMQARKRALRPTQTRACNVTWLGYYETMIEQALDIIGSKATAATLLNGDDLSSGLMQMDPGMSLLQELARRVLNDEAATSAREAIAARLEEAGAALKASLEVGAHDLVGVSVEQMARPDPNRLPPIPVSLPAALPTPPVPSPATIAAAALELPFLPSLGDGHSSAQPATTSGDYLTWSEVVVRQRRKGRGTAPSGDSQRAIQYSFVAE
ncbi:MAG TPA: hypothetical protein PKD53_13895, partial [Chloroflexaceae bacterium]|nr:hypothetical protein [Chloroflexaceae bacterium]